MNATRWFGSSALVFAAVCGTAGCGGGADVAMAPAAPSQPMGVDVQARGYAPADGAPAPPPPPVAGAPAGAADMGARAPTVRMEEREIVLKDRPGLGTQWGETRTSRISMVSFERADAASPFAAAALYYNDEEGARAMATASGFRRTPSAMFTVANGLVSVGLRDDGRRFFSGFSAAGRNYVVGEGGRAYTIVLRNNTNFRLEAVLSVDGLDVLDGKPAAFAKRGYIMDPRAELEIDGFRQSMDAVAAFRFGSVRGSYAGQKTGDTRNVGVIGVALFNEIGTNPVPWTPDEVQRRRDANPFPGQFATPP